MFFRRQNWNIVGWLKIVSAISYAVILAGVLMMCYNFVTHGYFLRLGLSFTGGTEVTAKFTRPVTQDAITSAMTSIGATDVRVNTISKSGDDQPNERYTIATQTAYGNDTSKLWAALNGLAPVDRAQSQISSVGPSLSHEYLIKAVEALVIAIGIQFIYIAYRFGWNYIFGLVTVIALVRDSLMMIGIYALAGKSADDAFLAAVLTVIGYSVMDTIVILDRIRENTKLMAGDAYAKIVNTSILQTMTRSVNTLATVVITLVALLAFGGGSLQNFAFALLVGICSGGYHSIFYSAPLVLVFRERQLKMQEKARERAREAGTEIADGRKPRTVAEARAQQRTAAERAEIAEKRRERREREKAASSRPAGGPVRYKRKRTGGATAAAGTALDAGAVESAEVLEAEEADAYEADAYEAELAREANGLDPLDAQQAGLHDEQLELGHEEIVLNLDAVDAPHLDAHAENAGDAEAHAHTNAPRA